MLAGSVLRITVWIVSIVLLLGVSAAFVLDRVLRGKYEPAIGAFREDVTANIGLFCEQQTKLASDPWFHEPRTEGDAGPLLNAWLPWEGQREKPKDSPLSVPAHLPQKSSEFTDWLGSSADVSTLDFEWMRKLHAYDRWDISRSSPVPFPARLDWASADIPDFAPVMLWTKFRLLHGLRTGQPAEAARDVRQLAWLCYRTDMLIGGLIAVRLLQLERDAYESLPTPPSEWHPMSREQLHRMRAVFMPSVVFSNMAAPVEVARQARTCGEPAVSRCMALTETAFFLKLMQPPAKDSYQEAYSAFSRDLAEGTCATALPQAVWDRGMTVEDHRKAGMKGGYPEWLDTLPGAYIGNHIAGFLLAQFLEGLKTFRAELTPGTSPPAKEAGPP